MKTKNPNVDGGWAWMVGLGTFISFFLLGGFFRSFGLLYANFLETFGQSASVTSFLTGVRSACTIIVGPMSTALSERFTERKIVILGALLISLGFCLSFLANSLMFLIFSLGVLPGIGATLLIGPSNVCMGKYFDKKRSRAFSMTSCGGCIGMIVVPILITFLMDEYSVKGALLIFGALMLHLILTGAFLRPLSIKDIRELPLTSEDSEVKVNGHLAEMGTPRDKESELTDLTGVEINGVVIPKCEDSGEMEASVNYVDLNTHSKVTHDFADIETQVSPTCSIQTMDPIDEHVCIIPGTDKTNQTEKSVLLIDGENTVVGTDTNVNIGANVTTSDSPTKPLSTNLNETKTKKGVKNFFRELFNLSLLKNPLFLMIAFSSAFTVTTYTNFSLYLVPLIESRGLSRAKAANLLSILGGCDIPGRLMFGYLADRKPIRPHHVMLGTAIITSVICSVFPIATSFYGFVILCVLYGLFNSAPVLLVMPAVVSCLGVPALPKALGLLMFFNGLVASLSPSLLGLIKDFSGSYDMIFPVLGAFQIAAGLVLALEPIARRHAPTSNTGAKESEGLHPVYSCTAEKDGTT